MFKNEIIWEFYKHIFGKYENPLTFGSYWILKNIDKDLKSIYIVEVVITILNLSIEDGCFNDYSFIYLFFLVTESGRGKIMTSKMIFTLVITITAMLNLVSSAATNTRPEYIGCQNNDECAPGFCCSICKLFNWL